MKGITNLKRLIKEMAPQLNNGEYIYLSTNTPDRFNGSDIVLEFKEREGTTIILSKEKADEFNLDYDITFAWITLKVNSSLEAVGLTAAFSTALAKNNISCNVIAGFYHDHIFVPKKDAKKAINVLTNLSKT